jgi:hypothetical protein
MLQVVLPMELHGAYSERLSLAATEKRGPDRSAYSLPPNWVTPTKRPFFASEK